MLYHVPHQTAICARAQMLQKRGHVKEPSVMRVEAVIFRLVKYPKAAETVAVQEVEAGSWRKPELEGKASTGAIAHLLRKVRQTHVGRSLREAATVRKRVRVGVGMRTEELVPFECCAPRLPLGAVLTAERLGRKGVECGSPWP